MNFNDYQKKAVSTAIRTDDMSYLLRMVLGLVGESGEIAEKFKKWLRNGTNDRSEIDTEDMKKELGDVLWYVAGLADELGISLEDIAQANVEKLASRKDRGVLHGDGDNR